MSWRDLVSKEDNQRIDPVTAAFLDEVEEIEKPEVEYDESKSEALSEWLVSLLQHEVIDKKEYNHLREIFHLKGFISAMYPGMDD